MFIKKIYFKYNSHELTFDKDEKAHILDDDNEAGIVINYCDCSTKLNLAIKNTDDILYMIFYVN